VERAKRSGGLHKRSAEDWGSGLRARGGWPPSGSEGRGCGQERDCYETRCFVRRPSFQFTRNRNVEAFWLNKWNWDVPEIMNRVRLVVQRNRSELDQAFQKVIIKPPIAMKVPPT